MQAAVYNGQQTPVIEERNKPKILNPKDALIREMCIRDRDFSPWCFTAQKPIPARQTGSTHIRVETPEFQPLESGVILMYHFRKYPK